MGLWYPKDSGFELIAYSEADHAGCKDDCKSTSAGLQFLGGKLVSWSSKKQDCTVMSTAEAEYVSLSACCAQVIWMRTQLLDYGFKYNRIPMYYDSKSAIAISCNPVQHSKTKHIDIRYHFIKEHVERGTVEIYFVGTEYQLADLFTKTLPKERFEYLVHRISMRCMTPTQLESIIPFTIRIAASASVPWIYMAQFWHTLKEDKSKNRLKFLLDRKELTLTLDDFRTIFHLPQANENNHASFVPPPSFSDMILQRYDDIIHVLDYTRLRDGSNRPLLRRNKNKVGMRIPAWMITDEMKLTKHYKMYAEVFRLDVPLTQSTADLPSAEKANEMILQDMIQVSLVEHKSREEQQARENMALVYEHLAAKEISKLVEDPENVDDRSPPSMKTRKRPTKRTRRRRVKGKNVGRRTRDFTNSLTTRSLGNLSTLSIFGYRRKTPGIDEAYVSGESSSGQVNVEEPGPSTSGLLWSLSVFIRSSVIWERVHDFQLGIESYQQKINLTAPTITFPGIEEYDVFSIVYEPVHGIIYTNSKKEKRYGYVQKELTNDEVEFLKLFEEEIEVRLNYRDQMRRWEMYVNGRPLGPRRERPE
ncbi:hypothetical protein Tco_1228109 [Tanacetum coccineum]